MTHGVPSVASMAKDLGYDDYEMDQMNRKFGEDLELASVNVATAA